jgi:hypothetical protein
MRTARTLALRPQPRGSADVSIAADFVALSQLVHLHDLEGQLVY